MEYRDYYTILGVSRDAKADEIKRAYRKLARKYHPDVSKEPNAEERFKEIQEAYEVLKDTSKRTAYDQLGNQWQGGQEFKPPPEWQGFEGFRSNPAGNSANEFSGFSDFFENFFGQTRGGNVQGSRPQRERGPRRGQDEHAKIMITLEEAFHGGSKTIQFQVPEHDAAGNLNYVTRTLKMTIPVGVKSGQQLRLAQQGAPGPRNGVRGDLYLEINIQPHRLFTLQGNDIYLSLPITPWEAALGAKVTVPTLGGQVDIKIVPESQAGQKLRLKGRGLPNKPTPGDQFVVLQILNPPIKTDLERTLYEKMAKEIPFNPRQYLFQE